MKHRAFTLVEIIIVIMITATVTVGLVVSFSNGRAQAEFKQDQADLTNLIQLARSSSLSSVLIDDSYETAYYELHLTSSGAKLTAYDESGSYSDELDSFEFNSDEGIELDDEYSIYYIPPYGEVCFTMTGGACDYSDGVTEVDFRLERNGDEQMADYTISIFSGYPEVD